MCGRIVNLDTVARVLAEYYHLKTDTQLAALDEALSRVPAETVGGGHGKDHVGDSNKMVGDSISRQAALDAMDTWDKFGCNPDGKLVRCDDDKHYVPYVHYDDMVYAIKSLPSAQQWIPCTPETMPKMTDTYLVQVCINENGEGTHTEVRTADWNAVWQTWYVHTTRCLVGDIIKWMPIPWKGDKHEAE